MMFRFLCLILIVSRLLCFIILISFLMFLCIFIFNPFIRLAITHNRFLFVFKPGNCVFLLFLVLSMFTVGIFVILVLLHFFNLTKCVCCLLSLKLIIISSLNDFTSSEIKIKFQEIICLKFELKDIKKHLNMSDIR